MSSANTDVLWYCKHIRDRTPQNACFWSRCECVWLLQASYQATCREDTASSLERHTWLRQMAKQSPAMAHSGDVIRPRRRLLLVQCLILCRAMLCCVPCEVVQQGKSTAGQRVQLPVLAAIMLAAQSVLVRWHADATSCKLFSWHSCRVGPEEEHMLHY